MSGPLADALDRCDPAPVYRLPTDVASASTVVKRAFSDIALHADAAIYETPRTMTVFAVAPGASLICNVDSEAIASVTTDGVYIQVPAAWQIKPKRLGEDPFYGIRREVVIYHGRAGRFVRGSLEPNSKGAWDPVNELYFDTSPTSGQTRVPVDGQDAHGFPPGYVVIDSTSLAAGRGNRSTLGGALLAWAASALVLTWREGYTYRRVRRKRVTVRR